MTFFSDNTTLRRQQFCAGAVLCRGTYPLHIPVRHVGLVGRRLFLRRSHQPERRKERQRAAQHAGRLHRRLADRPSKFAEAFRQHRRNDANRQRLHRGRHRLAVSLGRRILRVAGRAGRSDRRESAGQLRKLRLPRSSIPHQRNPDPKRRTAAIPVFRPYLSIVGLDNGTRDG